MQINVNQIRQDQLSAYIINITSGAAFSGNIQNYVIEGYLGANVLYTSGGPQIVFGEKTFITNPIGNYTGGTGTYVVRQAAIDLIADGIETYSGQNDQYFLRTTGAQSLSGIKTFISPIAVGQASNTGHAVRLIDLQLASGLLSSGVSSITVFDPVYQSGNQLISGQKTFVSSPLVPTTPTNVTGAINLLYLSGVSGGLSSQTSILNHLVTGGKTKIINSYFNDTDFAVNSYANEQFLNNNFLFTGYVLGLVTSGHNDITSGYLYQRTQNNTKVNFAGFSLNSGVVFYQSGGFARILTGYNRVGVDIFSRADGATGLSIGIMGVEI